MKILALEKEMPSTQPSEFEPYLREEAASVYELYRAGRVREFYFHQLDHTAVLILECADLDQARLVLGELPLVQAGLIRFDLIPLVPYPGLDRLMQRRE